MYLSKSAKQGFHQAMSLLVDNLHNLEKFEKFCKKVRKYSDCFVSNCLRYHANELAKGIRTEEEHYTVINLLRKAYFLGDFWSYYDICEILDRSNHCQAKLIFKISEKIYENRNNIGEILLENSKINIYAGCFRKGIGVEKNLAKVQSIYKKFYEDNESKLLEYTYLKGLVEYGKILHIANEKEHSFEIYKKFYEAAKSEDNISINRQFTLLFLIAKCLEKGLGCEKDLNEALLLYQLAQNTKKYCFYFEMKIKKKIEKCISRINREILDNRVVDKRTSTLCCLCGDHSREIYFVNCKHFHICEECQSKRSDKTECVQCKKVGNYVKLFL